MATVGSVGIDEFNPVFMPLNGPVCLVDRKTFVPGQWNSSIVCPVPESIVYPKPVVYQPGCDPCASPPLSPVITRSKPTKTKKE